MRLFFLCAAIVVLCVRRVFAARTYTKLIDIVGTTFYNEFGFFDSADPTHGRVTYVNRTVAQQDNLTFANANAFILRADDTTYLMPSDPGRNSVRLVSNRQYTTFVAIFDMRHMPEGCGTWPAVWTVGANWPNQGEIDVVEGINNMSPNTATLHTGTNCRVAFPRNMTGLATSTNCAAYETSNAGCGVRFSDAASFGPIFNAHQGGWYVLERNNKEIKVWFWSRSDGSVPIQVRLASLYKTVQPESWPTPAAIWTNETCDFSSHFGPHNIVINLTFCGDWASGDAYSSSSCHDTCENFVNSNPSSFNNAYFDFAAIRIYS